MLLSPQKKDSGNTFTKLMVAGFGLEDCMGKEGMHTENCDSGEMTFGRRIVFLGKFTLGKYRKTNKFATIAILRNVLDQIIFSLEQAGKMSEILLKKGAIVRQTIAVKNMA